ncbi:hypothetical protein ACF3N0_08105 [Moraxella atlantae]|uniref:hypothetical protein n=1 Tax=Faucicola atlantae TaxID=34059 RepID=UPI00375005DB
MTDEQHNQVNQPPHAPMPDGTPVGATTGDGLAAQQAQTNDTTAKSATKPHQPRDDDPAPANFRLSQALYSTILTNLNVILVLFIIGLGGWLLWYLSPLTAQNSTYNAEQYQNALALVVSSIEPVTAAQSVANTVPDVASVGANCPFSQASNQQPYQAAITRLDQRLTDLQRQKRLANHYHIAPTTLWQAACQQGVSADALRFAFNTLTPDKLMQLQWLEQRPNRARRQLTDGTLSAAELPPNWLTQTNPWYGLAGCVYIKAPNDSGYAFVGGAQSAQNQLCNHPKLIPPSVAHAAYQTDDVSTTDSEASRVATNEQDNGLPNATLDKLSDALNKGLNGLNISQSGTADIPVIPSTDSQQIALPANLGTMYSELSNIHANHFDRQLLDAYQHYQRQTDQRHFWQRWFAPPVNTIALDGANIKIGYNIALTLDPTIQADAQNIADCFTNSPYADVDCRNVLSPTLQQAANQMYEHALARSIGIAVLDVKTQGVLALASSDSACYRQDNGDGLANSNLGKAKAANCPTLWPTDYTRQNLMNHALYQTVHPGSIVKTVQALALVRANPVLKNPDSAAYRYLKQVMASSSTERVANFLYCQATTSQLIVPRGQDGVCRGMPALKKASDDVGLSANCQSTGNNPNCGFKDLLFGKPYNAEPMLQSRYFAGVMLTDGKHDYAAKQLEFTPQQVQSCVTANGGRMNGSCRRGGDLLNASMNEVFGAGNAKVSVLGAADMFANLLIADNGDRKRRGAHLIDDVWGVGQIPLRPKAWRGDAPAGQYDHLAMLPVRISQSDAHSALSLVSGTLLAGTGLNGRAGTAYSACQQAIGDCGWTRGVVIGKTGTPGFNYPTRQNGRTVYTANVTTSQVANLCNPKTTNDPTQKPKTLPASCYSRPYKWFIYGIKDRSGKWDKAVAVLVERNWQTSGVIDDPRDSINRAVQAGMLLAKQLYQATSPKTASNDLADPKVANISAKNNP